MFGTQPAAATPDEQAPAPKKSKKGRKGSKKRSSKKGRREASASNQQAVPVATLPAAPQGSGDWVAGGYDYLSVDNPYYGYALADYGDYYYGSLDALGGLAYMEGLHADAAVAQPPDADTLHLLQDPVGASPIISALEGAKAMALWLTPPPLSPPLRPAWCSWRATW